ncbi:hypothetical protein TcCL_NonESM06689 [Trypanosoma cruzi]|nr:hypothetical protein TcCL_NonESM06689 [Trypanosoma cruzi]
MKARTPRDRRLTVWRNSVPGVDPDIVPEWRIPAQARCDTCPLFDRPARALRITSGLCVGGAALSHCGDRPASASAGTSSRNERRNSLPTSERRIAILLPCLRQSTLVHPQREGTCLTCLTWRSDSLRIPQLQMPQWFHRFFSRHLVRWSPPKLPSTPAGKARRKHKRGHSRWTRPFRHRLVTHVTRC